MKILFLALFLMFNMSFSLGAMDSVNLQAIHQESTEENAPNSPVSSIELTLKFGRNINVGQKFTLRLPRTYLYNSPSPVNIGLDPADLSKDGFDLKLKVVVRDKRENKEVTKEVTKDNFDGKNKILGSRWPRSQKTIIRRPFEKNDDGCLEIEFNIEPTSFKYILNKFENPSERLNLIEENMEVELFIDVFSEGKLQGTSNRLLLIGRTKTNNKSKTVPEREL